MKSTSKVNTVVCLLTTNSCSNVRKMFSRSWFSSRTNFVGLCRKHR